MKKLFNNGVLSLILLVASGVVATVCYLTLSPRDCLIPLSVIIALYGVYLLVAACLRSEYLFAACPDESAERRRVMLILFSVFIILLGIASAIVCGVVFY